MIKMKQNKTKYFRLIVIAGLIFALQSCLKNNKYYIDFSKGAPALELPLAANNANSPFAVSFNIVDTPTTYFAVVNVASPSKPTSPVTGTLGLDTAYLNQYNTDNSTSYELMPDSTYSMSTWNITIPAGQRQFIIPIKIFTSKLAPGHQYVLPLTIVKSSIAISSWNHLLANIGPKNKYDGIYHMTISTTGWGAYGIADGGTNDWGKIGVVTAGASSVVFDIGYQPAFTASGAGTGFGATDPEFTFDANTNNLVSVTNLAAPDARNRQFQINSAATLNNWDPATKTMNLSYIMTQNGRPPQYINEVLTYVGPR